MTRHFLPIAVAVGALATGCKGESNAPPPVPSTAPGAPPASPSSSVQVALDRMDTRTPVPLVPMMANHQKQNMRDHLLAVQEIITSQGSFQRRCPSAAVRTLMASKTTGPSVNAGA